MQWKLDVAWLLYLWALGIADIRNLSVSKPCLVYGGVLAIVSVYIKDVGTTNVILGGVLGCIFILVSKYTREALGYGDSIMIMLISLWLGGYVAIYTLGSGFAMVAIYGGLQKWKDHKEKAIDQSRVSKGNFSMGDEVPFLPFLAMACTLSVLLC